MSPPEQARPPQRRAALATVSSSPQHDTGQRSRPLVPSTASAAVRLGDPDTSAAAARAAVGYRSRLRSDVLALHQAHPAGLTDDELVQLLPDDHPGSVAKRRRDLVDTGELVDSGRRRPTRRDCMAAVWTLAGGAS